MRPSLLRGASTRHGHEVEDTNGQVDYFGARAREAGMLSQGQHGGAMTDKAEQLLASRQRKYKKR